jgi:hypothetical protein
MPVVVWVCITQCASSTLAVDRAMRDETGPVYCVFGGPHRVAVDVHSHQILRRHLAIVQAERVDQEHALRPGYAQGDVVEDQLGPAEQVEHAIARRQLYPSLPLGIGHRDRRTLLRVFLHVKRHVGSSRRPWRPPSYPCPGTARFSGITQRGDDPAPPAEGQCDA